MSKYTVTADNLVGTEKGDTITADDLGPGVNVDALVASGHLKPVKPPAKPKGK